MSLEIIKYDRQHEISEEVAAAAIDLITGIYSNPGDRIDQAAKAFFLDRYGDPQKMQHNYLGATKPDNALYCATDESHQAVVGVLGATFTDARRDGVWLEHEILDTSFLYHMNWLAVHSDYRDGKVARALHNKFEADTLAIQDMIESEVGPVACVSPHYSVAEAFNLHPKYRFDTMVSVARRAGYQSYGRLLAGGYLDELVLMARFPRQIVIVDTQKLAI